MARPILLSEWPKALRDAFDFAGVKYSGSEGVARWEAPSLTVSIDLQAEKGYMIPAVRTGSSSTLPGDARDALAITLHNLDILKEATYVGAMLDGIRVYIRDCPCTYCGGRGHAYRDPKSVCDRCEGKGVRNEVKGRLAGEG